MKSCLRLSRRATIAVVAVCVLAGGGFASAQILGGPQIPLLPADQIPFLSTDGEIGGAPGDTGPTNPVDGDAPIAPDADKTLYGYNGPLFNPSEQTGRVEVLDQTLHSPAGPGWQVLGLARNQTAETVERVVVTAELRDASGALLDTVSATSAVRGVRRGEPVPFALRSDIPSSEVEKVIYSTRSEGAAPVMRQLSTSAIKGAPYGDRESIADVLPGVDTTGSPHPLIEWGQVTNLGTQPTSPTVLGAWADAEGRVLKITLIPRVNWTAPDGGPTEPDTESVEPNAISQYVYRNDDPQERPLLNDAQLWLWSWGT